MRAPLQQVRRGRRRVVVRRVARVSTRAERARVGGASAASEPYLDSDEDEAVSAEAPVCVVVHEAKCLPTVQWIGRPRR